MELVDRAENYHKTFPKWPRLVVDGGFLYGIWMIGNNYRSKSGYYGEYPPSYLKRVMSLFPDADPSKTLHLFSGSLGPDVPGIRFDINPGLAPTVVGKAEELSKHFPAGSLDLILADPPYSKEDAAHYGTPLPNVHKVVGECAKVLRPGGHLVWLDTKFPMYRKIELHLMMTVGIIRSTNHRVRMVFGWERL